MGNVGRYFCVALPFVLTVASIICILVVGLTGVVDNRLYLMTLNLTDTSIDPNEFAAIINGLMDIKDVNSNDLGVNSSTVDTTLQNIENWIQHNTPSNPVTNSKRAHAANSPWRDSNLIEDLNLDDTSRASTDGTSNVPNITAQMLGMANVYSVSIWGYCADWPNGEHNCTKAEFDWAAKALDIGVLQRFTDLSGINVTIPQEFDDALTVFKAMVKWTQVVFIIASIALGIELIVGLFTACSRAVSCVTWLVSFLGLAAVIAAAAMMTVLAAVVVGSVKASLNDYGATASLNTTFLAILWLGVAFALGASLFWLFSICCCKPEHRPHKSRATGHGDGEKLLPTGAYQPIGPQGHGANYNYGVPQQRGGARSDLAYEPYSHSNV